MPELAEYAIPLHKFFLISTTEMKRLKDKQLLGNFHFIT